MQAVDADGDLWLLVPNKGAGPERNLAAVARFETQEFVCRLVPGAAQAHVPVQSHSGCAHLCANDERLHVAGLQQNDAAPLKNHAYAGHSGFA